MLRKRSWRNIRTGRPKFIYSRLTVNALYWMFARSMSSLDKSPAIKISRYALRWLCSKIRRFREDVCGTYADENFDVHDAPE